MSTISSSAPSVIVIGGGIVGLAAALRITKEHPGIKLTVLEKEPEVARHQTGNNSGVIHSGLYYAPGSWKAKLALSGLEKLVAFSREHAIPHEICGKVVVATGEEELPRLQQLFERGTANGIVGMKMIGPEELKEHEPHARGLRALYVPTTGIIDYVAVSRKYVELIEAQGGTVRTGAAVRRCVRSGNEWIVETGAGEFRANALVNCAGLHCDRVARMAAYNPSVKIVPFRGEYYKLRPESEHLVKSLIYPVPDPAFPFLGVHFTRMIGGGVECGPNAVLAFKREGYRKSDIDPRDLLQVLANPGFRKLAARHWRMGLGEFHRSFSKRAFVKALQRLLPDVRAEMLTPAGAGVRAQALRRDGSLVDDFAFASGKRSLHVLNAPSPAATASLAIGEEIAKRYAATAA